MIRIYGDHCLLHMEWGGRKGSLSKIRLHYAQLASRGQQAFTVRSNTYKNKTKKAGLENCLWNVRTPLDKANSSRHERRSAPISHELSRLDFDVAAHIEIRLADGSSSQEADAGFTLFCFGIQSNDRRH